MIDEEKVLLLAYDTVTMQFVPSFAASSLCQGWEGEVKGDSFQQSECGTIVYHMACSVVSWVTCTSCRWPPPPAVHVVIKTTNSGLWMV